MKNSTHYIKTLFRHDDYIKDILERAAVLMSVELFKPKELPEETRSADEIRSAISVKLAALSD